MTDQPAERARTLPEMFFAQVEKYGERTALLRKIGDQYHPLSWNRVQELVLDTARGLITLGVKAGDRVAIMAYNRPEWLIADLAIMTAGGITVPIYHTSSASQSDYILRQSGAEVAFVARSEKAEMLATCAAPVKHIVSLDRIGADSPGSCGLDYFSLLHQGRRARAAADIELRQRQNSRRDEDCATIIFTSGTTGSPKGVMLSHANLLANARAGLAAVKVDESDVFLSFLPLSHSFERTVGQFLMLLAGATIAYAGSIRTVAEDIGTVRPTIMLGVPRFFEKLQARILDAVYDASRPRQAIFKRAMEIGRQRLDPAQAGRQSFWSDLQYRLADRLVFRHLRERLGGRLRFFVSGGAPLDPEIARFFLAAGVKILEGYGLTEHSPVIAVNRIDRIRPGTVGPPLPGCEVRIGQGGEVEVKSPSVMLGYYRNPEATAETVRDGWLLTGDLGRLEEGALVILDRKKDIIVTSNGKNITPQFIENLLCGDDYLSQVVLYGDKKNFLTALVVPDYEHLQDRQPLPALAGLSPEEMAARPELRDFLLDRIADRSRDLAHFETVRKIVVLDRPLTEEAGELTPTMKVKRKAVIGKFRDRLDALYREEIGKPGRRPFWP